MRSRRRTAASRGRSALAWALVFFAAGQAGLAFWLQRCHPEVGHPEFRVRFQNLQALRHEAPQRPLLVVLGSSRAAWGFRPPTALAAARPSAPREPIVFNFALVHSGPVRELLMLRRLLARGVRPRWVVVEVWAPFLRQAAPFSEQSAIQVMDLLWCDRSVLGRLYGRRWDTLARLCAETLAPPVYYRSQVLLHGAPFLLPQEERQRARLQGLVGGDPDAWGSLPALGRRPSAQAFALSLEQGRRGTEPILRDWSISPVSERALRELLAECAAHNIQPLLLLMPECSALRGWYSPAARTGLHAYLGQLSAEHGVAVIDARTWVADDDFQDFCHLLAPGAEAFSRRFGREVLRPMLARQPLPAHALLPSTAAPATYPEAPTAWPLD
jgi:hypothetical protein